NRPRFGLGWGTASPPVHDHNMPSSYAAAALQRTAPLALLVSLPVLLLALAGSGGEEGSDEEPATAASPCREVEAPPAKRGAEANLPKPTARQPNVTGVRFETSCGTFTVIFYERA